MEKEADPESGSKGVSWGGAEKLKAACGTGRWSFRTFAGGGEGSVKGGEREGKNKEKK